MKLFGVLALSCALGISHAAGAQFLLFDAPENHKRHYDLQSFDLNEVSDCVLTAEPDLNAAVACYQPFLTVCFAADVTDPDACLYRTRIIWAGLSTQYADHENALEIAQHFDPAKCDGIPYEHFDLCLTLAYGNRAVFGHIASVWKRPLW